MMDGAASAASAATGSGRPKQWAGHGRMLDGAGWVGVKPEKRAAHVAASAAADGRAGKAAEYFEPRTLSGTFSLD